MSSYYEMKVVIADYVPGREQAIVEAICQEWNFDEGTIDLSHPWIWAQSEDNLHGDEEEFAKRLARSIWKANAGPCGVAVRAVCLEDIVSYEFDKENTPE